MFHFGHIFSISPSFLWSSAGNYYLPIKKIASSPFFFLFLLANWPPIKEALLERCWTQNIYLRFSEWLRKNCQGKGVCRLHIRHQNVSPKRGHLADWIFGQWLHLNIQLLWWQSLPWNELFCLTSCCQFKLNFIFLHRNYPILCFSVWNVHGVGRHPLLTRLREKA